MVGIEKKNARHLGQGRAPDEEKQQYRRRQGGRCSQ
jgi:hypothetical protein